MAKTVKVLLKGRTKWITIPHENFEVGASGQIVFREGTKVVGYITGSELQAIVAFDPAAHVAAAAD